MIVELDALVRPFPFQALKADEKIELVKSAFDRPTQQGVEVDRSGTEARKRFVIADEVQEIAASVLETKTYRSGGSPHAQFADMGELAGARVGYEVAKELAIASTPEDVGDPLARKRLGFLRKESLKQMGSLVSALGRDKVQGAKLGEPLQFGPVVAACLGGAAAFVEFVPARQQCRYVSFTGVKRQGQVYEWICLSADRDRHLAKIDQCVTQPRVASDQSDDLPPQRIEARCGQRSGEVASQQRSRIVAEILAEPCQPSELIDR